MQPWCISRGGTREERKYRIHIYASGAASIRRRRPGICRRRESIANISPCYEIVSIRKPGILLSFISIRRASPFEQQHQEASKLLTKILFEYRRAKKPSLRQRQPAIKSGNYGMARRRHFIHRCENGAKEASSSYQQASGITGRHLWGFLKRAWGDSPIELGAYQPCTSGIFVCARQIALSPHRRENGNLQGKRASPCAASS